MLISWPLRPDDGIAVQCQTFWGQGRLKAMRPVLSHSSSNGTSGLVCRTVSQAACEPNLKTNFWMAREGSVVFTKNVIGMRELAHRRW